ncbi:MAG: response regulator [Nitrososphaera sp.]|nr:response regulator [Nitrososphaera sp.]
MSKPRILIADDEEGIRESLNLVLGDRYELVFAKDGEEALSWLSRDFFGAALLDIKMPKLDGLEVLRQLKRLNCQTPVLILTAYQSVELAKEAVKLGARDYLPKPFDRNQILKAVSGTLANAR